jgi:nitrogen fixation-related uncharacterized protein
MTRRIHMLFSIALSVVVVVAVVWALFWSVRRRQPVCSDSINRD